MTNDIRRGTWEMALAMAISGTVGWLVVSSGQKIADLLFWRCLFGALTLLAFCIALGLLRPLPRRRLALAALGGVAIVGNWLLLFASYRHASISVATVVYNTQPFMLVALGLVLLRERIAATSLGWLGLAFGGVLLIAQAKSAALPAGANYGLGIALALGAALLYAVAALVAKMLKGVAPHLIALIQMTVGTLMLAPWALHSGWPASGAAWGSFTAIGVVYTGFMYILLYGALQRLPTATAGTLSFIYPLVAVLVDHLAFGVRLGPLQWAGAAAILLAVAGLQMQSAAGARQRAA
jgi:drug/metabolite transporter (DMT)-like permease